MMWLEPVARQLALFYKLLMLTTYSMEATIPIHRNLHVLVWQMLWIKQTCLPKNSGVLFIKKMH